MKKQFLCALAALLLATGLNVQPAAADDPPTPFELTVSTFCSDGDRFVNWVIDYFPFVRVFTASSGTISDIQVIETFDGDFTGTRTQTLTGEWRELGNQDDWYPYEVSGSIEITEPCGGIGGPDCGRYIDATNPACGQLNPSSFWQEISWMGDNGITVGCNAEGTLYCPNDPVTRGQMATFMQRWLDETIDACRDEAHPFLDVLPGRFFSEPVQWMWDTCLTTGTSDTSYSPDDTVTRAQMVTFLFRALQDFGLREVVSDPNFTDVPAGAFYEEAVKWAYRVGITTGTSTTTFTPDRALTRGEMAAFIKRADDALALA